MFVSSADNWFTTYSVSGVVTINPGTSRATFRIPDMNRNVYDELGSDDSYIRIPVNSKLENINVAPFSYADVQVVKQCPLFFNIGLVAQRDSVPPDNAYKLYGDIRVPGNPAIIAQNILMSDIGKCPLYVTADAMEPVPMVSSTTLGNTLSGMFVAMQLLQTRSGREQAYDHRTPLRLLCTISYRAMRHNPYNS